MKNWSIVTYLVVVVVLLGYGIWQSIPSSAAVETQLNQLEQAQSIGSVDPNILSSKSLQSAERSKLFGTHPVTAPSSGLGRSNPFNPH